MEKIEKSIIYRLRNGKEFIDLNQAKDWLLEEIIEAQSRKDVLRNYARELYKRYYYLIKSKDPYKGVPKIGSRFPYIEPPITVTSKNRSYLKEVVKEVFLNEYKIAASQYIGKKKEYYSLIEDLKDVENALKAE